VSTPLRIGTRGSALALAQTAVIESALGRLGMPTTRVTVRTTGDVVHDVPLSAIGSVALFTKELDEALLRGDVDLAVHSLKDLPTTLPEGVAIAAVARREDPSDALVTRTPMSWRDLPPTGTVATSSVRRRAQLLAARPDLDVVPIRGNVDTRLTTLSRTPSMAATILAAAGLIRLGLAAMISERLEPDVMLPAPGQGAIAVTVRSDDDRVRQALAEGVHHRTTAIAVAAERALMRRLEGGCQAPIGALARNAGGDEATFRLRARVLTPDGSRVVEGSEVAHIVDEAGAPQLGERLAESLLRQGAGEIMDAIRRTEGYGGGT